MDKIRIEAIGGFVGAGAPGGKIHSAGEVDWSDLSPADQAKVDTLLAGAGAKASGNFQYRITYAGRSADVTAERVPARLIDSIRTTLD